MANKMSPPLTPHPPFPHQEEKGVVPLAKSQKRDVLSSFFADVLTKIESRKDRFISGAERNFPSRIALSLLARVPDEPKVRWDGLVGERVGVRGGLLTLALLLIFALTPPAAHAQDVLSQANFVPHFNAQIPLDLSFKDDGGKDIQLKDYFGQRPVILVMGYYNCPNLCDLVRQGLATDLKKLSFQAGKDFNVVTVSIDPRETPMLAMDSKMMFLQDYGQTPTDGIYFLTGQQLAIKQLADAVGFEYAYDAASGQFAHPSGVILLTAEGKISRYFYGVDFPDLRLGLVEASANKIGTLGDQILLRCFHYDPGTGKYTAGIMTILQGLGVVTILGLGGMVVVLTRRKRTEKA